MDGWCKKKVRLIKEFFKGQHREDAELEEEYIDWFFLHYFNRESNYWRGLTDDKIMSLVALEQEKEKEYWEIWSKMLKQMLGGK